MSAQAERKHEGMRFRAKFTFTVQKDRSTEMDGNLSFTQTTTAERVIEITAPDATKSDVLDAVKDLCESQAEEGFDTVDVRILKEKSGIDDWNWQAKQDIVAEDITHLRYDLPLDVRTVEYADFIEGVDGKVLINLGDGPGSRTKGSWRWLANEYVRQNNLEEYVIEAGGEQSALQVAVDSFIARGIDRFYEDADIPTEKLVEGAALVTDSEDCPIDTHVVVRGDLYDLRDPDETYWGDRDDLGPEAPPKCGECGDELPPGTIAAVEAEYDGVVEVSNDYLCGWCYDPAAAPDDTDRDDGPFIYPVGPEDAHYTPEGEEPLSHEILRKQRADEWRESVGEEEVEKIKESMQEARERFRQSDDEGDSDR